MENKIHVPNHQPVTHVCPHEYPRHLIRLLLLGFGRRRCVLTGFPPSPSNMWGSWCLSWCLVCQWAPHKMDFLLGIWWTSGLRYHGTPHFPTTGSTFLSSRNGLPTLLPPNLAFARYLQHFGRHSPPFVHDLQHLSHNLVTGPCLAVYFQYINLAHNTQNLSMYCL